jgi:hypothetical protein
MTRKMHGSIVEPLKHKSSKTIATRCKWIDMAMFIKREKSYDFLMEIEIESDFEFTVSASRLKETTQGGFSHEIISQEIHVPAAIEKALNIFDLWVKKIEAGDYEPPLEEDFENENVLAGLNNFSEVDGLKVSLSKRFSSRSNF